ncbi:hypothetical protein N0B31_12270 [Salinirubellus salinus]|jgi:hypothetical protein|uniref:Uncharacterized protein n=1 Tax=Salinirubellus salinus TaxID=1364945 RepID=A0A9E7U9K2_9EURY|nr:hypothetical protein [Salinirubellus salinus]UWM52924.1 hypothetical protein N0B31_12270 [Salinirubellus salinus]
MRRRALLGACSLAVLPGCGVFRGLDAAAAAEPGSVAIQNDDDRDHRVTVTVEQVSDDAEDVPPPSADRTPAAGTTRSREATFEVAGGGTVQETEFVTEPGAYFVTVELETGARATTWLGLSERAAGGVAGERLEVYVGGDGDVTAFSPSAE